MDNVFFEKVRYPSKSAANYYVNRFCISCGKYLWKTPVDNSVEIVEKSRFSTGISVFWKILNLLRKCIYRCIILVFGSQITGYVTDRYP